MTQTTKVVRFYEPVLLDQNDVRQPISGTFWTELTARLTGLSDPADRESDFAGVRCYGEARRAQSPAVTYVYVGRLRPPADSPDLYSSHVGITGPLQPPQPDDRISEPTFLLPFGANNYVAVMSPTVGGTRVGALERWTTDMCGLLAQGQRIEFAPLVDQAVLDKVASAEAATRLYVRVPAGVIITQEGGGIVGEAIREASARPVEGAYLDLTWSFGHAKGSPSGRSALLTAVRWLSSNRFTDKVEVSLQMPDGDGLRSEAHDLFRDRITFKGRFDVPEGQVPAEQQVLAAILECIEEFRRQV